MNTQRSVLGTWVGGLGIVLVSLGLGAATAQAGEHRFEGWSKSGWLVQIVSYSPHYNFKGPGNVMTFVTDLRTGGVHTTDGQVPDYDDYMKYAGVSWTMKGARGLTGWRTRMKRTGKTLTFYLVRGRVKVKLGSSKTDGGRQRLVKVRWSPGNRGVCFQVNKGSSASFHSFAVPRKLHRWRHTLSSVAPCRRYQRWARCVARAAKTKARKKLLQTLAEALKGITAAPVAQRSGLCLSWATALWRKWHEISDTATCFF